MKKNFTLLETIISTILLSLIFVLFLRTLNLGIRTARYVENQDSEGLYLNQKIYKELTSEIIQNSEEELSDNKRLVYFSADNNKTIIDLSEGFKLTKTDLFGKEIFVEDIDVKGDWNFEYMCKQNEMYGWMDKCAWGTKNSRGLKLYRKNEEWYLFYEKK